MCVVRFGEGWEYVTTIPRHSDSPSLPASSTLHQRTPPTHSSNSLTSYIRHSTHDVRHTTYDDLRHSTYDLRPTIYDVAPALCRFIQTTFENMGANSSTPQVSGWGVYCQASVGFLLLPVAPSVSCPCVDTRLTRSSKLPPSHAVSRCLPMSTTRLSLLPNPHPQFVLLIELWMLWLEPWKVSQVSG